MYSHERRWLRRLAILNDYVRIPYANGSSYASQFLYREMSARGHEVTIVGPDDPKRAAERASAAAHLAAEHPASQPPRFLPGDAVQGFARVPEGRQLRHAARPEPERPALRGWLAPAAARCAAGLRQHGPHAERVQRRSSGRAPPSVLGQSPLRRAGDALGRVEHDRRLQRRRCARLSEPGPQALLAGPRRRGSDPRDSARHREAHLRPDRPG